MLSLILLSVSGTNHSSYTQACRRRPRRVWTHLTEPKKLWQSSSLHTPAVVTHTHTHLSLFHPLLTWPRYVCMSLINHGWRGIINDLTWLCNYNGHCLQACIYRLLVWMNSNAATIKTLQYIFYFLPVKR